MSGLQHLPPWPLNFYEASPVADIKGRQREDPALPCPALKPGDFATVSRAEDCPPGGHRLPPAFWA